LNWREPAAGAGTGGGAVVVPLIVKAYVVSVATAAVAFFLAALRQTIQGAPPLGMVAALVALLTAAEVNYVNLSERNGVSVSPAFHSACYVLFDPGTAALMAAGSSILADIVGKRPSLKAAFNAAQYILCIGVAGLIYRSNALSYPRGELLEDLPVFALSAAAAYMINVSLVSLALLFAEGREFFWTLCRQTSIYLLQYLSLAGLGMLMAKTYIREPAGLLLILLPVGFVYASIRRYAELKTETRLAMEALADSIDQRDDFTFEHSLRVADHSFKIARELKLPEGATEDIHLAARIHDLGKVGLTNRVLFKRGHLSELEWERIREHPQIGENIAGRLKFYRHSATILRHHHENYDGSGYPDGLKGDNIPIGARIIRVADAFDAMATDRPYRKALPRTKAIEQIRDGSGTLFCPQVVRAFMKVIAEEDPIDARGR